MNLFLSKLSRWKVLIFLNAIYAIAGLAWIILIPYNNAPDENTHFHYSVEFIVQHHRLPVWGVDDIERFRHALSSYNQMPALNYVLYAIGAAAGNKFLGLETYIGARLVSLVWGLIFLNFLFLAVKEICGHEKNALIVSAAIALIPQVFFSFCYVNSDAHSLAIAAILGYALMRFLRKQSGLNIVLAGAAIGLLFSAKYNYYIYFPCIAVMLVWAALRRAVSWQAIGKLIIASALLSLPISGFWFIRNYILYGNPLPILMNEDFFRNIALMREVQPVNHGLNISSLIWLVHQGFISSTFDSFFAVFGYLNVGFHRSVYMILEFAIPAVIIFFVIDLLRARDRFAEFALIGLLIMISLVMAMHVWACLTFDYQAQGRYNFTILMPIALFVGWAITRHVSLRKHAVFFLVLMGWLFIGANMLIARTYGPPVQFAVYWSGPDKTFPAEKCSVLKAGRIEKNFYATEKISFGNEAPAFIQVDFPKKILARYRDFQIEFGTPEGAKSVDWTSLPPEQMTDLTFDNKLKAFENNGADPQFCLPLKKLKVRVDWIKIRFRIENRRLYNLK